MRLLISPLFVLAFATSSAHAEVRANSSAEEFAQATSACFEAMAAESPSDVLQAVENEGWALVDTTPIGGLFEREGSEILLRIETVFGSRICTALANRSETQTLEGLLSEVMSELTPRYGDRLSRDTNRTDPTLALSGTARSAFTSQQNGNEFNTQITTLRIRKGENQ